MQSFPSTLGRNCLSWLFRWPVKNSQHWLFFLQRCSTPYMPPSPQGNSHCWLFLTMGRNGQCWLFRWPLKNSQHWLFFHQGCSTPYRPQTSGEQPALAVPNPGKDQPALAIPVASEEHNVD